MLHLAGRVTDIVFSFLGPATAALAAQGARQTVVLIDDPRYRHLLPKFHESVRLVLNEAGHAPGHELVELLDAYCDAARARQPSVAHLHGLVCSILGLCAARFRGVSVPAYFSPHGSKSLGALRAVGAALIWLLRPLSGRGRQHAIASSGVDARALEEMTDSKVDLIESPVAPVFFEAVATRGSTPRIITSSRAPNPLGAALFAQCAVLLAGQAPGIAFAWVGTTDRESAARLSAASVGLLDVVDDTERAACLAGSWVYLAPSGALGFPVFLAEAMAAALPCVAWDTPYHRDVIDDGVTGFLCTDADEVLDRVAQLVESEGLRERLGRAAREQARARFDGARFSRSVLSAYNQPMGR